MKTSPPTPLLVGEGRIENTTPPSLAGKGVGGLGFFNPIPYSLFAELAIC